MMPEKIRKALEAVGNRYALSGLVGQRAKQIHGRQHSGSAGFGGSIEQAIDEIIAGTLSYEPQQPLEVAQGEPESREPESHEPESREPESRTESMAATGSV
jgi:DNA-directed RNA polymerase subunit K/omega